MGVIRATFQVLLLLAGLLPGQGRAEITLILGARPEAQGPVSSQAPIPPESSSEPEGPLVLFGFDAPPSLRSPLVASEPPPRDLVARGGLTWQEGDLRLFLGAGFAGQLDRDFTAPRGLFSIDFRF